MNIYLLTQTENNNPGSADSVVVVASSVEAARRMRPVSFKKATWTPDWFPVYDDCWARTPEQVEVRLLGTADSRFNYACLLCASFNG